LTPNSDPSASKMICRVCWRSTLPKSVFQCANCRAHYHLKCDTADANLVRSEHGLLVAKHLPVLKRHFNWCHLCQRVDNKLNHFIIDKITLTSTKKQFNKALVFLIATLKKSFKVSKDFGPLEIDDRINPFSNIISVLAQKVADEKFQNVEEFILDFLNLIDESFVKEGVEVQIDEYSIQTCKSLARIMRKEFKEMENCLDCYIRRYEIPNSKPYTALCSFPHFLVWAKVLDWPFWPAKLMWISKTDAHIELFGMHSSHVINLDNIFELSENYPVEMDSFKFNFETDDIKSIIESCSEGEISDVHPLYKIKKDSSSFILAILEVKEMISNARKQLGDDKVTIKQHPIEITPINFTNYTHVACVKNAHRQFSTMVAIKDNPIDLKDYEMKNVEQFSLRNRKPFTEIGGTLQASNHMGLMPEMQRSTLVNKINFGAENGHSSGYQNKSRSNFKSISNPQQCGGGTHISLPLYNPNNCENGFENEQDDEDDDLTPEDYELNIVTQTSENFKKIIDEDINHKATNDLNFQPQQSSCHTFSMTPAASVQRPNQRVFSMGFENSISGSINVNKNNGTVNKKKSKKIMSTQSNALQTNENSTKVAKAKKNNHRYYRPNDSFYTAEETFALDNNYQEFESRSNPRRFSPGLHSNQQNSPAAGNRVSISLADRIVELHSELMQDINNSLENFCFKLMKEVSGPQAAAVNTNELTQNVANIVANYSKPLPVAAAAMKTDVLPNP